MCQCNNDLILEQEREILTLRQQLEQAHADIAGLHDQLEEPQIAQDDYRLNKLELEEARQQVTLLRGVMNRIAFSRTGQCVDLAQELFAREEWAAESLAATEPKEQGK